MANHEIKKVCIDGKVIKNRIYEHGYSLKSIAKKIGVSDRTIRRYLNKNLMPEYMIDTIEQLFYNPLDEQMYPMWMRLGVTVLMPESTIFEIMKACESENGSFCDMDIPDETAKVLIKYARVDGDSYIPGCVLDYWKPWYENKKKELVKNPSQ